MTVSTHIYSGIAKIFSWLLFITLLIVFSNHLNTYGAIAIFLGVFIVHIQFLRPLSTMIYVKRKFGIRCSFREAVKLNTLFSPMIYPVWYPMDEALEVPESERLDLMFKKILELQKMHKKRKEIILSLGRHWKIMRIFLYVAMFAMGALGALSIGPFILLTKLQLLIFVDGYYPTLNALLAMIPLGLLVSALERRLKIPEVK